MAADTKGRSQTSYTTRVMASSAMGLSWGLWVFTDHIRKNKRKTNAPMIFAQTAVDAGSIRTWQTTIILITGKPRRPPIWAPCRDKNGAGSGISLVYLWQWHNQGAGSSNEQASHTVRLRGYYTPNQKLASFVLYLKIITTFWRNSTCIL